MRGGVSVNYHTLSDFRVAQQAALDDLLTQSIAVLLQRGIVTLARVAQDGTRVRGSAGAGSFRRGETLHECLRQARKQVERITAHRRTRRSTRGPRRRSSARRPDRLARVEEALAQLPRSRRPKRQTGKRRDAARVSTTDPDARVMKMADGGYRPAYNVHLATDVDSRVDRRRADPQQRRPISRSWARCWTPSARRSGGCRRRSSLDGGFVTKAEITAAAPGRHRLRATDAARRTHAPARPAGRRRFARRRRVARADGHRRGARRSTRRGAPPPSGSTRTRAPIGPWAACSCAGSPKVHTWALWIALAHNMLRTMEIVPHLMT